MSLRYWILRPWFLLCLSLLVFPWIGLAQAQARIGVLHPAVQEPFLSVFQSILRGIESESAVPVIPYALPDEAQGEALENWLSAEKIDTVIALGRQGALAAEKLGRSRSVIVGAVPTAPEGFAGISLSPDPAVLFQHLKELVPRAQRVHVVYSEANAWLMPLAEAAARTRGLKLQAYRVNDLREAALEYRRLFQSLRGLADAVWLPLDNLSADDEVVLPLVLQGALDRGCVVFSSKPSHAQRGALFSMYPDHFAMGQSLARMVADQTQGKANSPVIPLANLQLAVNLRTAFHLGLRFTPRQQERFDLIFPTR
ncbi:ABC transporter substrate-binding protein [Geoalkalibacter sp.]|jgi:putative ABC transport system substrate-binding protein|uniref:ABC transporter substrate-binding protein n=1 Tax=Geoalkalibacter sp. TaxID=3041440 RepID=UPI00272E8BC2|nr:ABC transporter substrate binding protein [Geoalkalibacter sp.]